MNVWLAKALIVASSLAMVAIRAPHGQRSRRLKVVRSRKGALETVLLTLAWLGFLIPLVWVATPLLSFADYPLYPAPFIGGALCFVLGLWIFHRSHKDLGKNWSISLETREDHELISEGVYRHIRHPMYLALLLYSMGQALALPNWVAGPSYGAAFLLLFALRVGPEERMMIDEFGDAYEEYKERTHRLIPGVW